MKLIDARVVVLPNGRKILQFLRFDEGLQRWFTPPIQEWGWLSSAEQCEIADVIPYDEIYP